MRDMVARRLILMKGVPLGWLMFYIRSRQDKINSPLAAAAVSP
jgi:hypothetical protein